MGRPQQNINQQCKHNQIGKYSQTGSCDWFPHTELMNKKKCHKTNSYMLYRWCTESSETQSPGPMVLTVPEWLVTVQWFLGYCLQSLVLRVPHWQQGWSGHQRVAPRGSHWRQGRSMASSQLGCTGWVLTSPGSSLGAHTLHTKAGSPGPTVGQERPLWWLLGLSPYPQHTTSS